MNLKIQAAVRLAADATSWFQSLSKEQQEEYLKLHPNSRMGNAKGHEKTEPKHEEKPHAENHDENHHAADSTTRRSIGKLIKDKAVGIVKHLKDEVKEAGQAGHAVTKLLRGKSLSHEEKHALKATAVRLAIVSISLAAGGGLAAALGEGVNMVAGELAKDFVKHGLVNAAEKTLMHSKVQASDDADAGLTAMTEAFAKYMATSPNVEKILKTANAKAPSGDKELDAASGEAHRASEVADADPTYDNHMDASDLHSYAADEHKKKGMSDKHEYHSTKSEGHSKKAKALV